MDKLMKSFLMVALLCATLNAQAGKAGQGRIGGTASLGGTSQSIVSIAVTPPNSSQAVNSSLGFSATATLANGLTTSLTKLANWTTNNQAIAKVDTLTNTQAITCVSAGTVLVTATYGLISGSTNFTCTANPPPPPPTLLSISVTPFNPTLGTLTSIGFIAIGTYSDGSIQNLTAAPGTVWTSSNNSVASLGSLTTQQLVNCLIAGTSTISATSGTVTGTTVLTCFVPLPPPPVLVSIAITPLNPSLVVPNGTAFIATGTYSDGSTKDLTLNATGTVWLSATPSVASLGSNADPQPATCASQGTSIITATNGSIVGQAIISCTNPPPPPPVLVSIAVTPSNASISVGSVQGFTATGTYSDGTTQDVTAKASWLSGTPAVAALTGLTTTENATCLKGGSSSISAAIGTINNNVTLTCNAVLTSITVTPVSPQTNVGTAQNFIATCNYNDGSSADCTIQAAWTSGTPSHATVAAKADPQSVNCIATGTSVITAALGVISGTSTLTCLSVGPPPPTLVSLAITPANPTVNVGSTIGLIATCTYSDATTRDCTISQGTTNTSWASGTPSHVTVASPVVDPEVATCIAAGTSVITATNGSTSGTTTVTCQAPTPTLVSIAVTPLNPNQTVGSAIGFTATCTYSDSTTANCTTSSQGTSTIWTSSNIVVATVAVASSPQNVNCLAVGSSTVKAAVGATNGTTTLTCQAVVPPTFGNDAYEGPGDVPRFGAADSFATLPQAGYYTDPSVTTPTGTVRQVTTASAWNSVWALTNCGDIVELIAGTTYVGNFTVPSKPCTAGHYTWLRTSGYASLPAYGKKVTPCYAGVASLPGRPNFNCIGTTNVMATLQTGNLNPPLTISTNTSFHRETGIVYTRTAGGGEVLELVTVNNAAGVNHVIFDHVWGKGTPNDETNRFMVFNRLNYAAVIDGFFTDFHCISGTGSCTDAKVIGGGTNSNATDTDHAWKVVNNYMEGAAQSWLLGGAAASIVPCDIEYRNNWGFKPLTWNPADPSYNGGVGGHPFIVKNLMEFKTGCRILVEGNVFQNVWAGFSQVGEAITITPKNQFTGTVGICPICATTNITIRYNKVNTAWQFTQIVNTVDGPNDFATAGNSYSIHDNVADNLQYPTCYQCQASASTSTIGSNITNPTGFILGKVFYNHNTAVLAANSKYSGYALGLSGPLAPSPQVNNIVWTNNIFSTGNFGFMADSTGSTTSCGTGKREVTAMVTSCWNPFTVAGNAIVHNVDGNGAITWPNTVCSATNYSSLFTSYGTGNGGNYVVNPANLCHNSATDGLDPGANIPVLNSRTAQATTF